MAKLNRRSQARIKRMNESLENSSTMLNRIEKSELEELICRDEISVTTADSGGGSSFAIARRGGKPSGSPVERAVIARLEGRKPFDPVREEVKKIERLIIQAEENLRQVHASIVLLKEGVEKERGRKPTTEPCEICTILPAVKTAMCFECYKEWVDAGGPDRFRWKAYKRQMTSSDGITLVTEQPTPRRKI